MRDSSAIWVLRSLSGLATGAGRRELVRAYVLRGTGLTVLILSIPSAVLCWRPELWLGLFSQDPGILRVGNAYLRIVGPSYPCLGVAMVMAFAFQGIGKATTPLLIVSVRMFAVLLASVVATQGFGLRESAVFSCVAAGNLSSMLLLCAFFTREIRTA